MMAQGGPLWKPRVQGLAAMGVIRLASLEMHPLDTEDRIPAIREEFGSGMCNITRCLWVIHHDTILEWQLKRLIGGRIGR